MVDADLVIAIPEEQLARGFEQARRSSGVGSPSDGIICCRRLIQGTWA
jgi:hypothetical protein